MQKRRERKREKEREGITKLYLEKSFLCTRSHLTNCTPSLFVYSNRRPFPDYATCHLSNLAAAHRRPTLVHDASFYPVLLPPFFRSSFPPFLFLFLFCLSLPLSVGFFVTCHSSACSHTDLLPRPCRISACDSFSTSWSADHSWTERTEQTESL